MQPLDLINLKREHVKRLANQNGAAGEIEVLAANVHYVGRPKGLGLDILMAALRESGVVVKRSSFDAIALPEGRTVEFTDKAAVMANLPDMVFVEIKTATRRACALISRVSSSRLTKASWSPPKPWATDTA